MMGMPSCLEVARRLSREQDEPEPRARSMALRMHLLFCNHCRRYDKQLRWLRFNTQRALMGTDESQLSASAHDRIRSRLARERS